MAHPFSIGWRSGHPGYSEIVDGLLVGEYPLPRDARWLSEDLGVTAVVNLQDDHDLAARALEVSELERSYSAVGITLYRIPTEDSIAGVCMRLDRGVEILSELAKQHGRTYLHCNGGTNRAPTMAIAYLHYRCRMHLDDAVALVAARRECAPYLKVFA